MQIAIRIFGMICLLTLLGACATTKLVSTWQKEGEPKPLSKVMVIGISDNASNRRIFEDKFAKLLKENGVQAFVSYDLLPDPAKINRERVEKVIKGKGFDSVLVTHYEGTNEETVYRPGTTYSTGFANSSYYGHYRGTYNTVYTPGYYVNYKYVFLETNIFSTADAKPVWSARSKTTNPEKINKDIDELGKAVISELRKSGLIK